jgi:hypothetical protein
MVSSTSLLTIEMTAKSSYRLDELSAPALQSFWSELLPLPPFPLPDFPLPDFPLLSLPPFPPFVSICTCCICAVSALSGESSVTSIVSPFILMRNDAGSHEVIASSLAAAAAASVFGRPSPSPFLPGLTGVTSPVFPPSFLEDPGLESIPDQSLCACPLCGALRAHCSAIIFGSEVGWDLCRMCAGCVQGVCRVCAGCVQGVCRVCAGCVQGVCRVGAECVQGVSRV